MFVLPAHARAVINFRIKTRRNRRRRVVARHEGRQRSPNRDMLVLEPKSAKARFPAVEHELARLPDDRTDDPPGDARRQSSHHHWLSPLPIRGIIRRWRTTSIGSSPWFLVPTIPLASTAPNCCVSVEVYRNCVRFYVRLLINESDSVGANLP